MTPEVELVLGQAIKRRSLLEKLSQNGSHIKRQPWKTQIIGILTNTFISDIEVHGVRNIGLATDLLDRGEDVTLIGNHTSDADPALRRATFTKLGYQRFADRLVWVAGLSMVERWYTRIFMGSDEAVLVVTPFDLRRIRKVIGDEDLTVQERQLIKEYGNASEVVNRTALNTAQTRKKDGFALSIFPESTRSRNNGLLQEAPRETAILFPKGYVLPVAAVGAREMVPVNGSFQIKRVGCRVDIGEPVLASEIWRKSSRFYGGKGHNPAEVAMAYVAQLNQDIVPDNRKAHYKALLAA